MALASTEYYNTTSTVLMLYNTQINFNQHLFIGVHKFLV
jgi:hypothetical protein